MKISCHFILFFTITLVLALTTNTAFANMRFIKLNTVDKDLTPIKPELVRWWFSANATKKTTIYCKRDDCTNIQISETVAQQQFPITIFALHEQSQAHDKECWDWYEAEAEVTANQSEVTLVLENKSTVCK